jgi:putative spermidine/putrescine transport system ATP-binding protein/spermidine/putrescine transport system ATP-binding protein
VAKFIGRNALIPGQAIAAVEGGMMLDTAFGQLAGACLGESISVGQKASLAVPAEAIDVLPLSTSLQQIIAGYGGNPVRAKIGAIQQVGHIVQIAATIGASEPVQVEFHADKYAGRYASGDDVLLAWRRDAATLISH